MFNKEFIKILILIIEPKLTFAISRVPLPRMTACTVALEQIWNDFRVNLVVAFEILRTVVLPERLGPFSLIRQIPKKLLLISISPEKGDWVS